MTDVLSNTGWRSFSLVAGFGGLGGLANWLWPLASGEEFKFSASALLATMFLGAVAGVAGTYVLKVESSRLLAHSLALALVFGLFWKPTLEAARDLVLSRNEDRQVAEQIEVVSESIDALNEAGPERAAAVVEGLGTSARSLLSSKSRVRSPRLRAEIDRLVVDSIAAMNEAAPFAPEASARALGSVGAAAIMEEQSAISHLAADSLVRLAEQRDFEPGTSAEVSNSLVRLSAAARASQRDDVAGALVEQSKAVLNEAQVRIPEDRPELMMQLEDRSLLMREFRDQD